MATAQLINLDNYDTLLAQSSVGRSGSPDGNIYFDLSAGEMELITAEEAATVDLTNFGGSQANPLTNQFGITMGAIYAFERQERRIDENLREFDFYFTGSFKFAGAYEIVNSRKFADTDRVKIRASGWIERAIDGGVDRIYFGARSLGNIDSGSAPYYQLADFGPTTDFAKVGPIDEAVQVYGDTGNVPIDSDTSDFDTRTYMALKVRTFGNNYDKKELADSGITEMGGYGAGFAIGESVHLTTGSYALADVYTAPISPWTGMALTKLAAGSEQVETGFNEADGTFAWILSNSVPGSLNQCVAYLDALAQADADIDSGAETDTTGREVNTWYSYNAGGQIVTTSGADSLGLFIENVPTSDQQSIVFTDDAGSTKTYPFNVEVQVTVGSNAAADSNAWYHAYYEDGADATDFNTADAITVYDADTTDVKGSVSGQTVITFSYAYDSNDQAGLNAGDPKSIVFECEGDGVATQEKTIFTITRIAIVTATCAPGLETNV